MKHLLIVLSLFVLSTAKAQDKGVQASFNMEGQFTAATDGKGAYLNFGGPGIKFQWSKFAFCWNMFPSIRLQHDGNKPLAMPILGTGPQFCFLKDRRFVIAFPCYYAASRNVWVGTVGIGYILTRPKKIAVK